MPARTGASHISRTRPINLSITAVFGSNRNAHPCGGAFFPLFYQGDVRWENQFRRNRNRQNFVVGSYFPTALKSRKNPRQLFSPVSCSQGATCGIHRISTVNAGSPECRPFRLWISL